MDWNQEQKAWYVKWKLVILGLCALVMLYLANQLDHLSLALVGGFQIGSFVVMQYLFNKPYVDAGKALSEVKHFVKRMDAKLAEQMGFSNCNVEEFPEASGDMVVSFPAGKDGARLFVYSNKYKSIFKFYWNLLRKDYIDNYWKAMMDKDMYGQQIKAGIQIKEKELKEGKTDE